MPRPISVPSLMLVTDRLRHPAPIMEVVRRAVDGGVDAVQVREKDLHADALFEWTASVVEAVGARALVLVNGNVDVAKRLAVGVHLPELGAPINLARTELGGEAIIGRSVHSAEAAGVSSNADYLLAGHVFPTRSKPNLSPLGVAGLGTIVRAASCPVLAIGGIEASNVAGAIGAGAHGAAVMSAIGAAADPERAAREIRSAMEQAFMKTMEHGAQTVVHLIVNGKDVDLPERITVAQFLASRDLHERLVVVEVNGTILRRPAYASSVLSDGDRVEIVHFVGGG